MKLGMIIMQTDPETVFNGLRLVLYSLEQGDRVFGTWGDDWGRQGMIYFYVLMRAEMEIKGGRRSIWASILRLRRQVGQTR